MHAESPVHVVCTVTSRQVDTPARCFGDSRTDRVTVVIDVSPADPDDLRLFVGEDRLVLRVDAPGWTESLAFRPKSVDTFGDDHDAVYNNGVLTVTMETAEPSNKFS